MDVVMIETTKLRPHPKNEELYSTTTGEEWDAFVASVRSEGVLQPLVVTPDYRVVSGHRRHRAAQELGISELPCIIQTYETPDDELRAIVEYNRYRNKTIVERMREAELLEEIERRKAAERQLSGKPSAEGGNTRDIVAAAIGVSGRTYEKMKYVYDRAKTDPTAQRLMERIDRGEASIDGVYKTLRYGETKTWLDFNPKVYTVWSFTTTDARYGQPHPGQIHPGIIENVLWFFTREGDLVVDPFAGGGVTIDVCNAWGRRVLAYDIDPRRPDIRRNDIRNGYPPECEGANLVFLDPPYGNMIGEDYSPDGAGAYPLDEYIDFLRDVAVKTQRVLAVGGYAAFIMMTQYYRLPDGIPMLDYPYIWYRFFLDTGMTPIVRVYNLWPTTIWQPYHVVAARQEKRMLPIVGELVVLQKRG